MWKNRRGFFVTGSMLLAGLILAGRIPSVSAQTFIQHHAFGTITRGSTVCVGPLSPTTDPNGNRPGVQIAGFTNGASALTWQLFTVSSQSAPALVFSETARFVDHTEPPQGNFLFHACVVKRAGTAQDFDLTLNSQPLE